MKDTNILQSETDTLIEVKNLKTYFPITSGVLKRKINDVKAVDGLSFKIKRGETLGLVGESGCGKTVTARTLLKIYKPTEGEIWFQGKNLANIKGRELSRIRRHMQVIFQNPYASLDPRMPVGKIIAEPMEVHRLYGSSKKRKERMEEYLTLVGLSPFFADRFPFEFSGGQRQRIAIARALATQPDFIVCDDPISALDVSIQAQIVNLLQDLQEEFGLTYLFIAHDLIMLRHICDRIAIMYLGKFAEVSPSKDIYDNPLHPYTQALLSAVPIPDPKLEAKRERIALKGGLPDPANPPMGCNFSTRCPQVMDICHEIDPILKDMGDGHEVACHLYEGSKKN